MTLDPLWLWLAQIFQPVSIGIAVFLFGFGAVLVIVEIIRRILGN